MDREWRTQEIEERLVRRRRQAVALCAGLMSLPGLFTTSREYGGGARFTLTLPLAPVLE